MSEAERIRTRVGRQRGNSHHNIYSVRPIRGAE